MSEADIPTVNVLLGYDDINHEKLGNYGQTPLWAPGSGKNTTRTRQHQRQQTRKGRPNTTLPYRRSCPRVVKILLGRHDVDLDSPAIKGRMPLCSAVWNGEEGLVNTLPEQDNANHSKLDKDGKTPPDQATQEGYDTRSNSAIVLQPQEAVPPHHLQLLVTPTTPAWSAIAPQHAHHRYHLPLIPPSLPPSAQIPTLR